MWIKTDDMQFVKKINKNEFDIVNILKVLDKYRVYRQTINVEDYMEDKDFLLTVVRSYGYKGIQELHFEHEEKFEQILAEMISETLLWECDPILIGEDKEDINEKLMSISMEISI